MKTTVFLVRAVNLSRRRASIRPHKSRSPPIQLPEIRRHRWPRTAIWMSNRRHPHSPDSARLDLAARERPGCPVIPAR